MLYSGRSKGDPRGFDHSIVLLTPRAFKLMKFRDTNFKRAIKNIFLPKRDDVVVLEPHLGLGDGIICLGLVRELSRRHPRTKFYYACLHRCYQSLAWMFQDLDNVYLFAVNSGRDARQLAGFLNASYMPIGIDGVDIKRFDAYFYEQHQVDFGLRWSDAKVSDGPKATILFEQLNSADEPYILVCNSESGMMSYNLKILNPDNKKIIEVKPLTNNIFDWARLVFQADEIHTIDTAFVHFVESLMYQSLSLDLHYHLARKSPTEFTRRLPWKLVEY